jgi:hypothetical protein
MDEPSVLIAALDKRAASDDAFARWLLRAWKRWVAKDV